MDFMVMFDRKFMAEGLVCVLSILEHGVDTRVFVLCLDQEVEKTAPLVLPERRVTYIRLQDLEKRYPEIAATKASRPWPPYTQSLKPFLPEHIFDTHGAGTLTYVDSDLLFWGDCGEIDREMGIGSFMVTSREEEPVQRLGSFNGGCFSCRDDRDCRSFLRWWQARCVEWCLWEPGPRGRFGEEGYLDIIRTDPKRFAGTRICGHPGVNLAPWNIRKHRVEERNGALVVDGHFPLVCYHYQGLPKDFSGATPPSLPKETPVTLYATYAGKLAAMAETVASLVPAAAALETSLSTETEISTTRSIRDGMDTDWRRQP